MTILNRLYASSGPEVIIETLQINIGDEVHYLCKGYEDITATTENGDTVTLLPVRWILHYQPVTLMAHRI